MNCDWPKDFVLDFQPIRSKTKGSHTLYVWFFLCIEQITCNWHSFCLFHCTFCFCGDCGILSTPKVVREEKPWFRLVTCLPKSGRGKKKQWEGDVIKSQFCVSLTHYGRGKLNFVQEYNYHILVLSQHQLQGEMLKTRKKIYAASSNATSSSRLCKSEGDFSHCKNLFGKANHALLLAA